MFGPNKIPGLPLPLAKRLVEREGHGQGVPGRPRPPVANGLDAPPHPAFDANPAMPSF